MKCEKCDINMEKGFFDKGFWVEGDSLGKNIAPNLRYGRKASYCVTWKCPKCKKLEFYTE